MKTTHDSAGNPYIRKGAMNITCPACEQDVDTAHPENIVRDPHTERLFHKGCVQRLNKLLNVEDSKML